VISQEFSNARTTARSKAQSNAQTKAQTDAQTDARTTTSRGGAGRGITIGGAGRAIAAGTAALLCAAGLVAIGGASANAASAFTPGDVVVYRVGDGTTALGSAAAPVFLDEYTPSGTLVQSTELPTTASGSSAALTASGSATSEGLLTLSGDGRYLIVPGYDAPVGTAKISGTASASIPRTVGRVGAAGEIDTTTALTDFATGNNPRSATSSDGTDLWVGGAAGGARYTTLGSTTSTELDSGTYKNVREVSVVDGQLYTSADPTKASATIATVGSGLPTAPTQPVTNLPFATQPTDPYAYSLLTLGNGSTPDTIYEADNASGAVFKYGLVSGAWVSEGSVQVSSPEGLTAGDDNGTVTIYVTSSGANGTTGVLQQITDASGVGGTLSGVATTIATLPANEASRGVAFAPGTTIGTGGGIKPPVINPTITTSRAGLPAALGDTGNETLGLAIGAAGTSYAPEQLTVTATSSNQAVLADSGISITGSGADLTLTATPAGTVGKATITLTVKAPDGTTGTAQVVYGVSADVAGSLGAGESDLHYYSGAANASAAVDVGDGFAVVADDESDVIRLYNTSTSGAPVRTFDFSSQLPFGSAEIDLEAASRSGNIIYWEGSMSTSSSGNLDPSRSTLFATQVSGSGASTTLTYLGSYTGLLNDLIAWDQNNGSGEGANALGLAASAASGTDGHAADALNVEGMEFAGPTSSTAYLAFRAPLEPTTNRHLAMLIPVTNFAQLPTTGNPGTVHATFGAPIFFDLGGLGIRDIKENADGQYLIIAGTADDSNSGFALYSWDGNPAHAPQKTGTPLPQLPSSSNLGAWETIVSVPSPLAAGAKVKLLQDDGDVDFYGSGLTSKTGEQTDLQKNLGLDFGYVAPALLPTSTSVVSSSNPATPGAAVTLTATVSGPSNEATVSGGTVTFIAVGADGSHAACTTSSVVQLGGSSASCVLAAGQLRAAGSSYTVTATYSGTAAYAASSATLQEAVTGVTTKTIAASLTLLPTSSRPIVVVADVIPSRLAKVLLTGAATVSVVGSAGVVVYSATSTLLPIISLTDFTIPAKTLAAGSYTITVRFPGDEYYAPSSTSFTVRLLK
jgi:hypothetical protein